MASALLRDEFFGDGLHHIEDDIALVGSRSRPGDNHVCLTEDRIHSFNLSALLHFIILLDTESVYPDSLGHL